MNGSQILRAQYVDYYPGCGQSTKNELAPVLRDVDRGGDDVRSDGNAGRSRDGRARSIASWPDDRRGGPLRREGRPSARPRQVHRQELLRGHVHRRCAGAHVGRTHAFLCADGPAAIGRPVPPRLSRRDRDSPTPTLCEIDLSKFDFHERYDMNKILTAVALAIALPAVAHAEAAPAPAAEKDCCEKMKAEGKDCCKDMDMKDHAGHDMKGSGETDSQHK